ncbi:MAG: glucose-6-phosphate isomerase family protein [Candidatus Hydrothermarchaeaceae archaeon]
MRFGNREVSPDIRMLSGITDVVYDRAWLSDAEDAELYYMYRDLYLSRRDRELITQHGLRYDITVIPPRMLGVEYVKTLGHHHPNIPDAGLSYTEIYEVLEGEAHYLIQKGRDTVEDVAVFKAGKGDKVIIPPDYGHVTINPSNKVLKMSNWVCGDFSSFYGPYEEKKGAAYFEIEGCEFVKNQHCADAPEIRFLKPTNFSEFGLKKGKEMYGLIREDPSLLRYLTAPQEFPSLFEKVLRR